MKNLGYITNTKNTLKAKKYFYSGIFHILYSSHDYSQVSDNHRGWKEYRDAWVTEHAYRRFSRTYDGKTDRAMKTLSGHTDKTKTMPLGLRLQYVSDTETPSPMVEDLLATPDPNIDKKFGTIDIEHYPIDVVNAAAVNGSRPEAGNVEGPLQLYYTSAKGDKTHIMSLQRVQYDEDGNAITLSFASQGHKERFIRYVYGSKKSNNINKTTEEGEVGQAIEDARKAQEKAEKDNISKALQEYRDWFNEQPYFKAKLEQFADQRGWKGVEDLKNMHKDMGLAYMDTRVFDWEYPVGSGIPYETWQAGQAFKKKLFTDFDGRILKLAGICKVYTPKKNETKINYMFAGGESVMIPFCNEDGAIVGFRKRNIVAKKEKDPYAPKAPKKQKYSAQEDDPENRHDNVSDPYNTIYNLNTLKQGDHAVLIEGEFKAAAISATYNKNHTYGDRKYTGLGTKGINDISDEGLKKVIEKNPGSITLLTDFDPPSKGLFNKYNLPASQLANYRIALRLRRLGYKNEICIAKMPSTSDNTKLGADDWIVAGGAQDLYTTLNNAVSMNTYKREHGLSEAVEKFMIQESELDKAIEKYRNSLRRSEKSEAIDDRTFQKILSLQAAYRAHKLEYNMQLFEGVDHPYLPRGPYHSYISPGPCRSNFFAQYTKGNPGSPKRYTLGPGKWTGSIAILSIETLHYAVQGHGGKSPEPWKIPLWLTNKEIVHLYKNPESRDTCDLFVQGKEILSRQGVHFDEPLSFEQLCITLAVATLAKTFPLDSYTFHPQVSLCDQSITGNVKESASLSLVITNENGTVCAVAGLPGYVVPGNDNGLQNDWFTKTPSYFHAVLSFNVRQCTPMKGFFAYALKSIFNALLQEEGNIDKGVLIGWHSLPRIAKKYNITDDLIALGLLAHQAGVDGGPGFIRSTLTQSIIHPVYDKSKTVIIDAVIVPNDDTDTVYDQCSYMPYFSLSDRHLGERETPYGLNNLQKMQPIYIVPDIRDCLLDDQDAKPSNVIASLNGYAMSKDVLCHLHNQKPSSYNFVVGGRPIPSVYDFFYKGIMPGCLVEIYQSMNILRNGVYNAPKKRTPLVLPDCRLYMQDDTISTKYMCYNAWSFFLQKNFDIIRHQEGVDALLDLIAQKKRLLAQGENTDHIDKDIQRIYNRITSEFKEHHAVQLGSLQDLYTFLETGYAADCILYRKEAFEHKKVVPGADAGCEKHISGLTDILHPMSISTYFAQYMRDRRVVGYTLDVDSLPVGGDTLQHITLYFRMRGTTFEVSTYHCGDRKTVLDKVLLQVLYYMEQHCRLRYCPQEETNIIIPIEQTNEEKALYDNYMKGPQTKNQKNKSATDNFNTSVKPNTARDTAIKPINIVMSDYLRDYSFPNLDDNKGRYTYTQDLCNEFGYQLQEVANDRNNTVEYRIKILGERSSYLMQKSKSIPISSYYHVVDNSEINNRNETVALQNLLRKFAREILGDEWNNDDSIKTLCSHLEGVFSQKKSY